MAVETSTYLMDMMPRMIRAAGRRAAEGDEPELAALISLKADLDDAIQVAVDGQRSIGRSWAAIAAGTGTSRQAAQQRWGKTQSADDLPPVLFDLVDA